MGTSWSAQAPGYVVVDPELRYSPAIGYGWSASDPPDTDGARDRPGSKDPLAKDFVYSSHLCTFLVDVPVGKYDVTTIIGDADYGWPATPVVINGELVGRSSASAIGSAARNVWRGIAVKTGRLSVRTSRLCGLEVVKAG
jgi:hypothetical protein